MAARPPKRTLVGVAGPGVVTGPDGTRRGKWSKWSPLYDALEAHYDVAGILQPQPPRFRRLTAVRQRLGLGLGEHPLLPFERWTGEVDHLVQQFQDEYDFILQLQTLFACGADFAERPVVVYTDNTLALTLRHYPSWWPSDKAKNEAFLDWERRVTTSALAVCTFSEWARRSMIDDYGCDPRRVFAVGGGATHAGVMTDAWDRQVALFVGVDFERKGGSVLLDAWPGVRARLPRAELWIAGPRKEASSRDGIRWLGRRPSEELAAVRAAASVFVLPSLFEPWGLVLNEAMASGLPCIGTTACAMPEIIREGVTGLLVPPDDPTPLTDALVELLGNPIEAERMGRAAFEDYLARGTWDSVADNVANAVNRVQGGPPGI